MARKIPTNSEKAAKKIQACFRGYIVRKNIVHKVRKEFENLMLEIEYDDLEVYWKSSSLCLPKFIGGGKRVRIKEEVEYIPIYEQQYESELEEESDISFDLVERKVSHTSDEDSDQ